jgi:hypothetical protein
MANVQFGGYPAPLGPHMASIIRHSGPSSYTVLTAGASPSGGDAITPQMFGFKWIEWIGVAMDETGAYYAIPTPIGSGPTQTFRLRWFTIAGGPPATVAEVTAGVNLSAINVHLLAIGQP